MIVLAFIDIDKKIVPDEIILSMIIIAILCGIAGLNPGVTVFDGIIGAIGGGFILLVLNFFSNGKIGEGDIKLLAATGFFTGFKEVSGIIMYAFILGGVYAFLMLISGRHKKTDAVAFVPFIAAAFIVRALVY